MSDPVAILRETEYRTKALERDYAALQNTIAETQKRLASLQADGTHGNEKVAKLSADLAVTSRKAVEIQKQLEVERARYAQMKEEISQEVSAPSKVINTEKLTANIREMLKVKKDIKIGQIEKDAGTQPGYLSRFEKDPSKTPSIDFVYTAAKELGISMDILIEADIATLTDQEKFLLGFLDKLERGTINDSTIWDIDTASEVLNTDDADMPVHPLVDVDHDYNGNPFIRFNPRLHLDGEINLYGNSYHVKLDGTQSFVYLMQMAFNPGDNHKSERVLGLYIVTPVEGGTYNVSTVCNSKQTSEPIQRIITDLYKAVTISATHVHITDDTKTIMDAFMNQQ